LITGSNPFNEKPFKLILVPRFLS
jgi:hypothetical protein